MSLFEQQYDDPLILPLPKPQLPPPPPREGSTFYDRVMRPGARRSRNVEDLRQPLTNPADIAAAREYDRVINKGGPDEGRRFDLATGVASMVTGRSWDDQKALARTLVTRLHSPARSRPMRQRIDGGPPEMAPAPVMVRPTELNIRPNQPRPEPLPVGFAPTDADIGNQTEVMQRGPDAPVAPQQRRVWTPEEAEANNRMQRERITQVMAGRRQAEVADERARQNRGFARPPQAGQIVRGYRYLGGDPRNRANWQFEGGA